MSGKSAYDLIGTSTAASNVQEVGQITREQARPLMKLPDAEQQREAIAAAVKSSPTGKPTAREVEDRKS
jgi:hypothetical protein